MASNIWDSKAAHWYAENYGEHPSNVRIVEFAKLQEGESVLDIGCGSGTAVIAAAQQLSSGSVLGIDPTPTMVELAKEQLSQKTHQADVSIKEGGAEKIPAPDHSFDIILALNSFHHWGDVDKGIAEVKRVLKENGRFIIGTEQFEEGRNQWPYPKIIEHLSQAGFEIAHHSIEHFDDSTMDFVALTLK